MKKTCLLVLALMACLFMFPVQAETDGDFAYTVKGGKATITAYTGSADILTVPDTLGGYPVTAIRYCAFRDCGSLVQITLPGSVTSIGSNAFERCAALSRIDLGNSLSFIGTHAFYGCVSLSEITLPESLERLHPYAFYGCSAARLCGLHSRAARALTDYGYAFTDPDYPQLSLMAYDDKDGVRTFTVTDCDESAVHVAFPEGVTRIDGYAFFGCAALTQMEIPDGVTEIAYSAFEGCASLQQITLPGSAQRIAGNAFARCPAITLIAPEGSAAHRFAESSASNGVTWKAP